MFNWKPSFSLKTFETVKKSYPKSTQKGCEVCSSTVSTPFYIQKVVDGYVSFRSSSSSTEFNIQ